MRADLHHQKNLASHLLFKGILEAWLTITEGVGLTLIGLLLLKILVCICDSKLGLDKGADNSGVLF